jgi:protein involved in polysaccharide export with SLBB domain/capsular polysaccharide biosynthesis protein/cob(I)alamin adenosyltransferase
MNENAELSIADLRKKKAVATSAVIDDPHSDVNGYDDAAAEDWTETRSRGSRESHPHRRPDPAPYRESNDDDEAISLPFDPFRLIEALKRKLIWCILFGMVCGSVGLSWFWIGAKAAVSIQLARREAPAIFNGNDEGVGFQPPKYTDQALVTLMQSPEMVRRVASKANPPIPPVQLARSLKIYAETENEVVNIVFDGKATPQLAAELVNLYGNEVLSVTRELQTKEAKTLHTFLDEKISSVNTEITRLNEEMKQMPAENRAVEKDKQAEAYLAQLADIDAKYELARIDYEAANPINDKLQLARDELSDLMLRFTDEHPHVQRQREKIKLLENQVAQWQTNAPAPLRTGEAPSETPQIASANAHRQTLARQIEQLKSLRETVQKKLSGLSDIDAGYSLLKNRYSALERIRSTLASRQREAELFLEAAPGYYTILAPATAERVNTKNHLKKTIIFTMFGAFFGFFSVAGLVLVREFLDDRVKTSSDVERATELPVLGTLGDVETMNLKQKKAWAFRTWTILRGKLRFTENRGVVCGFISANHGEGKSTWVKLLASTAHERGLRVLTISAQPSNEPPVHPHEPAAPADSRPSTALVKTLSPNVFACPAQVIAQLTDQTDECPSVHIPLPGWCWNLERRKQWQSALAQWRQIENLVLLVELPPASEPESILLAEKLPQLIWVAESAKATLKETRQHIETLNHAGCNLVGAVLNREPKSFLRNQISRWFPILLAMGLGLSSLEAEETNALEDTVIRKGTMSVSAKERPQWSRQLTLGPGDVMNIGFFGETNLTKTEISIGPDGRISYLQATDVLAAGLTVDELRQSLDKALSKYYRAPRTMITPVTFRSKKYYVLGKVMTRGVFTLDRPITVLEAVARANGLETGLLGRTSIEMADIQRSLLLRRGERIPIDFEKLFNEGDLSQNIALEPDDYLYFPPASLKEVYVVGEVATQGVVPYTENTSIMSAIAERGGFNQKAYKSRVLVVRGSLNRPETFVVNTHDIVDGKMPDFKLQPKDIIYVSFRPFIRAEELLDLAATSFIQSATTTWTGQFIGPLIKSPFIHGIYDN